MPSDTLPDQPLPTSLLHQSGSWSTKAQYYPVFSQTWFRYRLRGFLLPCSVITVFLLAIGIVVPRNLSVMHMVQTLLATWVLMVGSLLTGRCLAVWVCRQGWSKPKEGRAVIVAIVAGMLLVATLVYLISPGQMSGVHLETRPVAPDTTRINQIFNIVINGVFIIWLGGLGDLLAYFRQGRELERILIQEQMQRYKNERNQIEMRLSVLASQVEPHFLFNTLSGVRAAILTDPERGVAIIDNLVEYLRSTIPQMRNDGGAMFVPLVQQLDSVRAYLGVIRGRIQRLSYSVESGPGLEDCVIPPLMLISLVENAVKHGIELKKGPVSIKVEASRLTTPAGERVQLRVIDNGLGFAASSSGSGIGLSNIRERLQYLYGASAALSLQAVPEGGVVAELLLPIRPDSVHPSSQSDTKEV